MKAVKNTGIDTHVLNVSFPDNTIPALAKIGLAPTSGMGNASLILDAVRYGVAHKLSVPMRNVSVTMIAHHAFCMNPPGTVPYYARIRLLEEDITSKLNVEELIGEAQRHIYGPGWSVIDIVNQHTAAQGARIAAAIANDTGEVICAPGVDGNAGTLPARFDAHGATIVMPPDLTMERAKELFDKGREIDGIERYEKDGTIVFTEPTVQILEEGLGLKGWRTLALPDAQKMAKELIATYEKLL
jgi:malate/lactate dehydrogenase